MSDCNVLESEDPNSYLKKHTKEELEKNPLSGSPTNQIWSGQSSVSDKGFFPCSFFRGFLRLTILDLPIKKRCNPTWGS